MSQSSRRWGRSTRYSDARKGREKLVHSALAILIESGANKLTASAVADQSGISRRTVYRYFPDRDGILEETIRTARQLFFRTLGNNLQAYVDDFPTYFEEGVISACFFRQPKGDNYTDVALRNNAAIIGNYIYPDERYDVWRRLFESAYLRFKRRHPEIRRTLEEYVEIAYYTVAVCHYLQVSEDKARRYIHGLRLFRL